jgi:hypothetical protein
MCCYNYKNVLPPPAVPSTHFALCWNGHARSRILASFVHNEQRSIARTTMLRAFLFLMGVNAAAATVCQPANSTSTDDASWVFDASQGSSYSCYSSAGATNDINGNAPTQCEGDPTSVRAEVLPGQAECLVATAFDCKVHASRIRPPSHLPISTNSNAHHLPPTAHHTKDPHARFPVTRLRL